MTAVHSPKSGCEISGTRVRGLPFGIRALKAQGMRFFVNRGHRLILFSHRHPTGYIGKINFNNYSAPYAIASSITAMGVVIYCRGLT